MINIVELADKCAVATLDKPLPERKTLIKDAIVAACNSSLPHNLPWTEEDPRMLREQIRVADVAYNNLHERWHKSTLANAGLAEYLAKLLDRERELMTENERLRASLDEYAKALSAANKLYGEMSDMKITCLRCGQKTQLHCADCIDALKLAKLQSP